MPLHGATLAGLTKICLGASWEKEEDWRAERRVGAAEQITRDANIVFFYDFENFKRVRDETVARLELD